MRFIIIGLIIFASIGLLAAEKEVDNNNHSSFEFPPLVDFSQIANMASIILFAFVYQIQFPSIAEFVQSRAINLKKIVRLVASTAFILYAMLGIIVPMAIHDVLGSCNLSFREYSAGYAADERPWWTFLIAYIIVLFPAFDVFSSFPLMAIPLSDNILTLKYGVGAKNISKRTIIFYRVSALVLPFAVGFLVYDLVTFI